MGAATETTTSAKSRTVSRQKEHLHVQVRCDGGLVVWWFGESLVVGGLVVLVVRVQSWWGRACLHVARPPVPPGMCVCALEV